MNFPVFTVEPMTMRQLADIFLPEHKNVTNRTRRFAQLLSMDDELVRHLHKANVSLQQTTPLSLRAVWIIVRRLQFTKLQILQKKKG